ncbi:cytochrome c3 family protein [Curtanaerobium respiraculi]|uniref:cytochrome c3 family protein n=1 Tax=Curtanaerobium respiraculi TaxID=2949669 RepID=UPI0024B38FAF|nr:cytochrome c3 family protein [Curtanaerobium respiraculi]
MAEEKVGATPEAKRRKRIVTGCIIAAVVVAAIGGFMVWHSQPTFCNAVCHTPMDSYVESYYDASGTSLAHTHAKAGKSCLDCHPSNIGEQVTEAGHWLTGDYVYDENTKNLISRGEEYATQDFCLQSGCHDYTLDQLAQKTSNMAWNPHNFTEHGVTECSSCHKMHDTSVMVCSECHYQAAENVPAGWDSIPYREEK